MHGAWTTSAEVYAAAARYAERVGRLDFAAPQDWMCEPFMTERTGLSVAEHQARTVASYIELRRIAPDLPFIPVLQGLQLADYLTCADLYAAEGIDLTALPLVGLGSVCRRQSTAEIAAIAASFAAGACGCTGSASRPEGFNLYGHRLASADSMAWSYAARRQPPLPGCTGHKNCLVYAARWRARIIASHAACGWQPTLFDDQEDAA